MGTLPLIVDCGCQITALPKVILTGSAKAYGYGLAIWQR
jgi:hypothetical protein